LKLERQSGPEKQPHNKYCTDQPDNKICTKSLKCTAAAAAAAAAKDHGVVDQSVHTYGMSSNVIAFDLMCQHAVF